MFSCNNDWWPVRRPESCLSHWQKLGLHKCQAGGVLKVLLVFYLCEYRISHSLSGAAAEYASLCSSFHAEVNPFPVLSPIFKVSVSLSSP